MVLIFLLGEMRNDLYITMERGEFEKGGKSVARNVEVTMFIVENSGQILKVCEYWVLSAKTIPCHHFGFTFNVIS